MQFKCLFIILSSVFIICPVMSAQEIPGVPVLRLMKTRQRIHAQSYEHLSETRVDFAGTALMPKAHGTAKVKTGREGIEVELSAQGLGAAAQIDPTCLTYVLWAIPANQGKPQNLGELVRHGDESKLTAFTDLPIFAMVVTAEPYFAVEQPSQFLVLQNVLRNSGNQNIIRADLLPLRMDSKTPLDIYEARNAVRIARLAGAERYAAEPFHKALQLLQQSENLFAHKKGGNIPDAKQKAREATQAAEEARATAEARNGESDPSHPLQSTP
jgi:hypothetical protein